MADDTRDRTSDKAGRAARLARELRANLARRKQQARSRDAGGKAESKDTDEADGRPTEPRE